MSKFNRLLSLELNRSVYGKGTMAIELKDFSLVDKLLVILVIGFIVFVGGWLFGRQDFFTKGFGMCSDVWNPRPVVNAYMKQYYPNALPVDCAPAADARKETILFAGIAAYSILAVGFLYLCSRSGSSVKND